jgi:hypothetical protein
MSSDHGDGDGDDFLREAQASVSLLGFDVQDLDEDVALLDNISCWLSEPGSDKGASGCVSAADSPRAASPGTDEKASSTAKRRRRNRTRRNCAIGGCLNRVVQGGVCVTHGAKRKLCKEVGCDKAVKKAGYCSTHGPARKRCDVPGCSRVAVQGGICIGHGAKQTVCAIDGCRRKATHDGRCKDHEDNCATSAVRTVSPAMAAIFSPALPSVLSPEPVNHNDTESQFVSAPFYEIPHSEVGAAVAQVPAPSLAFQKTMYARGLSIFEEMGVLGKPLPPPPPLQLPKRQRVRSSSFSNALESLYDRYIY